MRLQELGPRLCIVGPSNSGKSTLARAIGRQRALPVVHLDQLHHLPGSDWVPRPREEFIALHDAAILGERWVMEGNYSVCMPQRLARATGLLLLDVSVPTSLLRYLLRTWGPGERLGSVNPRRDRLKWSMLRHIAVVSPGNRRRYAAMFEAAPLPKLQLRSRRAIARCYREWGLQR